MGLCSAPGAPAHSRVESLWAKALKIGRSLRRTPRFFCGTWPYESKLSTARHHKKKSGTEVLDFQCFGDSHGIQTHNLLIRSQMLYSVELGSQVGERLLCCGSGDGGSLLLLDPGFLAGQASQVEDTCATHLTDLVEFNRVDERGVVRENTLDSDSVRHFAYRKGLGNSGAAFLEHDAAEFLDTFLAFALCGILLDAIGDGDGVTGLEIIPLRK